MSGFGEANFSLWLSQFTRTGSVLVIFGENSPVSVIQNTPFFMIFMIFEKNSRFRGNNSKNLRLPPFE